MPLIISDPQVQVNDDLWLVKANTVTIKYGLGAVSVKGLSSGGAASALEISENVEERFSAAKMDIPSDAIQINKVKAAKRRLTNNVLTISGADPQGNSVVFVMTNAVIMNDPEFGLAQDGATSLEWAGDPSP